MGQPQWPDKAAKAFGLIPAQVAVMPLNTPVALMLRLHPLTRLGKLSGVRIRVQRAKAGAEVVSPNSLELRSSCG